MASVKAVLKKSEVYLTSEGKHLLVFQIEHKSQTVLYYQKLLLVY